MKGHGGRGGYLFSLLDDVLFVALLDAVERGLELVRLHRLRLQIRRLFLLGRCRAAILQESVPAQIRQLILHFSSHKGSVAGFVRESTFAK